MQNSKLTADYPGRLKNLKEVKNLLQLVEFILPYGLAKIYMTANRRWSFLEKDRRKIALALLINRVVRRFAFSMWDVRSSNGGFAEDFHTMPIISIIDILTIEYATQEKFITKGANFGMATFKLCGNSIINSDLKRRIEYLHDLKIKREKNLTNISKRKPGDPPLYLEASRTLYELEECLIHHHNRTLQRAIA